MKRSRIAALMHVTVLGVLLNLTNSLKYLSRLDSHKVMAYFAAHILILLAYSVWLSRNWNHADDLLRWVFIQVRNAQIPRAAKRIFLVIFIIEAVHIGIGKTNYPFADVGMFRFAAAPGKVYDSIFSIPKYYYFDNNEVCIVEIRKQHIWFFADVLTGIGYNNEYTFSAAYHYKGHRENFEMLSRLLKEEAGVDTLWVGLHSVNYRTGEVWFDPDIKRATKFNDSAYVFYGPIYIPDYQCKRVYDQE